jgi:hypothetical protein
MPTYRPNAEAPPISDFSSMFIAPIRFGRGMLATDILNCYKNLTDKAPGNKA